MSEKPFQFLGHEAFGKLSQREKLNYLARAAAALGKTAAPRTAQHLQPDRAESSPGTLGAVLYGKKSRASITEKDWAGLVQSIAAGDPLALHGLYERTNRPVFTLLLRITGSREIAEKLTLSVFYDIWLRAPYFEAENDTALGWVMEQARSRASEWSRFTQGTDSTGPRAGAQPPVEPGDVLSPSASLQRDLAHRISADTGGKPVLPSASQWKEPEWEEVAPGISCKLLATDTEKRRVSMLVRLVPGGEYPPHTHAGIEELHLLDGELWIDDRKIHAGGYNRAEPGTGDKRVWSETGCTCVLITSTEDILT
jgi:hypothetical protein